jgi:hypothetical protein
MNLDAAIVKQLVPIDAHVGRHIGDMTHTVREQLHAAGAVLEGLAK